jgi:SAM-dependent methyltransferase
LVYANPLPVPASVNQHYEVAPRTYWGDDHLPSTEVYLDGLIRTFFLLHPRSSHLKALDVGAGLGNCVTALRSAEFETQGLEPSPTFYREALRRTGLDASTLTQQTVESVQFEPDSFDLIVFEGVLEHLEDPAGALMRALGWLKPDGLVYVEVPSARWLTARLVNLLYRLQGLDYAANLSPMHPPFHLYEFTPRSFLEHGRRHGHRLVHHYVHATSTFLPASLDPVLKPLMRRTQTGLQLEVWVSRSP